MSASSSTTTRTHLLVRLLILGWVVTGLLWAANVWHSGGSVAFIAAALAVAVYLIRTLFDLYPGRSLIDLAASMLIVLLVVGVPLAFDTRTGDVFNLTKFTVVVIGVLTLTALVALEWARTDKPPLMRNGLQWPVAALVIWTAATTITSTNVRVSLLGFYKSYDGLFTTVAVTAFFFLVVHLITINHVRAVLSVLYFGAGSLAVLYGLLQLHDRTFSGPHWDWVNWGSAAFVGSSIWATFGNPNHFAGFLAILLPIGIVLLFVYTRTWVRTLVGVITICLLLELLQTTTRGAWLAAIVTVPMIVALLWPEFRKRPLISLPIAGLLLVGVFAAVIVLGPTRSLGTALRSAFQFGTYSSAEQRVELWQSAWKMGLNRPILGFGPDTFRIVFPRYQSARFVSLYGPDQIANGPHNIFMNYLASSGFPGLAIFLALIVFLGVRSTGAWKRLRRIELEGKQKQRLPAQQARYLLVGAVTAALAYLIQATFNVQQVALTFCFWTVVAVATVVALDAGVPDTLDIRRILDRSDVTAREVEPAGPRAHAQDEVAWLPVAAVRMAPVAANEKARIPRSRRLIVGAALATPLVAIGAFEASRPYRADLSYFRGLREEARSRTPGLSHFSSTARAKFARRDYLQAADMNRWEPLYLQKAANVDFQMAQERLRRKGDTAAPSALALLESAKRIYARAVGLQPDSPYIQDGYARVLIALSEVDPNATTAEQEAVSALRSAIAANPWQPSFATFLSAVLANEGELQQAMDVVDSALRYSPTNADLLQRGSDIANALGNSERAKIFSDRLAAVASTTASDTVTTPPSPSP